MLEDIMHKTSNFDLTSKSTFSKDDEVFTSRSYAALLAKNVVPISHKKAANNYTIINRVFKFQAVMSRITNVEKALLTKYNFKTLEFTTAKEMYEQLELLQQLTLHPEYQKDADEIIEIRTKELKFIIASRYATISNEIYKGYIALESYFKEISRFN